MNATTTITNRFSVGANFKIKRTPSKQNRFFFFERNKFKSSIFQVVLSKMPTKKFQISFMATFTHFLFNEKNEKWFVYHKSNASKNSRTNCGRRTFVLNLNVFYIHSYILRGGRNVFVPIEGKSIAKYSLL